MSRNTLKSRTVRSSLILLRENLRDLRAYSEAFDVDQIDRLVKAAELTSTVLKKLQAHIAPEPTNDNEPASAGDGKLINIRELGAFLDDVSAGRICPACGGRRTNRAA